MRPTVRVLPPELIPTVLAEAKRILAEIGVEVRGSALRARLLDYGLQERDTVDDGPRMLFPPEVVDAAITSAPHSFIA